MFQYRRTTSASRRAERKVRYLHVSAEVISIPHYDASGKVTHATPVLATRAYFPKPNGPRGNTFDALKNKTKRTDRSVSIKARVMSRAQSVRQSKG